MEGLTRFLQKWRVRLGHIFALVLLFFARPTPALAAAGTALVLLGEGLRILSAGYIEKDSVISRGGPYAFVRNPLYVGSFVMYLGMCVAAGSLMITAVYLPLFLCVYYATIFREEQFLREKFGAQYDDYVRRVPRFVPRLRPVDFGVRGEFALSQVRYNREYEGLAGAVIILVLLWVEAVLRFSIAGHILK